MVIYEEGDETLETQVKHWALIRKEQVLLHAARQQGLSRIGLQPVPALQVTQVNARQAIEMHLLLQSLALSPFAREPWTLSETSREMFKAPPVNTFKKGGETVHVIFDGDKDNTMQYQKWIKVYYTDDTGKWQRVGSNVDHTGIFFDRGGEREYYVKFDVEAKRYSTSGLWEVHDGTQVHLPVVPITSSSPAPGHFGGTEIRLHGCPAPGHILPLWDPRGDELSLRGGGGGDQKAREGGEGQGHGQKSCLPSDYSHSTFEDTYPPRHTGPSGAARESHCDIVPGRDPEPEPEPGPEPGPEPKPTGAKQKTAPETARKRRGREWERERGRGRGRGPSTSREATPDGETRTPSSHKFKRPRGRRRGSPTSADYTAKFNSSGGDEDVIFSPPTPDPPRLRAERASATGLSLARASTASGASPAPPSLVAVESIPRDSPAVDERDRSTKGTADIPPHRTHGHTRTPCLLILKGRPNAIKCLRYRLKKSHPELFQFISTTWSWVPANAVQRVGRARILVMCKDSDQKDNFLRAVKPPKGITLETCSMLSI